MSLMQRAGLLIGDNTIPGVKVPKEVEERIPEIFKACRDFGLDFFPTVVEFLTYDEISEVAAYGGFPVRYPHWKFGQEYEELSKGYEHGYHRIFEMVVNCLHPETPVLTGSGTISASNVKAGDTVFANNDPRKVIDVIEQKSSKIYKISLCNGSRPIRCTPNHKWYALTEQGPAWVETKELKNGDILFGSDSWRSFRSKPFKIDWNFQKVVESTNKKVRNRLHEICPPEYMTVELAEFLGILTGDGSCGVCGCENQLNLYVDKNENDYLEYVFNLSIGLFGKECVSICYKESINVISVCSKAAVDFVDYLGIPKGCTYKTKRVPYSIFASSNEYRAAYLRGLFDTDGYSSDCLGFSAHNHELCQDVQLMLAEMGIYSKVDRIENDNNSISVLTIQGRESIFLYKDRIGFILEKKCNWLEGLINTEDCVSGGQKLPFIQDMILSIAKEYGITSYNERSLGRSINSMKKSNFGKNALYSFVFKALLNGYENYKQAWSLLRTSTYEIESVIEDGENETIDIVLDHDEHNFIAGGLLAHNTSPCYLYCLDSNSLIDHITVIAHATGHNDFFKNNIHFAKTPKNMMDEMANHGSRIRRYMSKWGRETVSRFIDKCLSLETLLDPAKAWVKKQSSMQELNPDRKHYQPRRLKVEHEYMEDWIHPPEWKEHEKKRIAKQELIDSIGLFTKPEKDIFGYLKDNAPLKPWQQDVISMLYEEAAYFAPQRTTKVINEGFASFVDSQIMARFGFAEDGGIFDYAKHKASVLGGKLSMNPYNLGYLLFLWAEEKWNKGRFGNEYDECEDIREKEKWDKRLGLGYQKVFEVREFYDDLTLISEFFDQEFCDKYQFFEWKKLSNGEYKIHSRDADKIKQLLLKSKLNGGLPEIKLVDPNHKGQRIFLMEHSWDGRILDPRQSKDTLRAISWIWNGKCALLSKDKDGNQITYECDGERVEIIRG